MEKIKKYETIIVQLLNDLKVSSNEDLLVIDHENHHYQLLFVGLDSRNSYHFRVRLHFHIREDGVICIFENRTEAEVGDILMQHGVPKSDILVGFLPQHIRQYEGYAAA
jgi:hypothetical protein